MNIDDLVDRYLEHKPLLKAKLSEAEWLAIRAAIKKRYPLLPTKTHSD